MSADRKMCDERGNPRSPLDRISNLEPVSEEFIKKMTERHEQVILPNILEQERARIEAAHEFRKKVLF
jgi:hypothetical protein